ncbi:hypothetical protein ACFVXG_28370 [Kitasatospora sp. NPDC058162]|uniref:hypothetical protein n=1 Tax=Kitasatospora sp. NPDC058162 TaxID=3346362 RepID=UPI0036DCBC51
MRRTVLVLLAVGLTATAAACSSSGSGSSGSSVAGPAATTPTATGSATFTMNTPSAAPTRVAPGTIARSAAATFATVAMAVPSTQFGRSVTAEDDPNHLLGRPGQYTSKVTFTDTRIKAADVDGEDADSVARGGAVEVFATQADAERRAKYVQDTVKSMPALMEYDYVKGTVLIRVSKLLTPAQAANYQGAIGA